MAKQIEHSTNVETIRELSQRIGAAIKAVLRGGDSLHWDVEGGSRISHDLSKVHADNLGYAAIHGWLQRDGDAAALGATYNKKLGRIPTLQDKVDAMTRLIAHYESGDDAWDRERVGFKRVDETLEILVKAMFAFKAGAKTLDECRAFVAAKSKDERYQMFTDRNSKLWVHVKAVMEEATKGVKPTDELLGDF